MESKYLKGPASETNLKVEGNVREAWNTLSAAFDGPTVTCEKPATLCQQHLMDLR
jgi:hypothetical protein